MDRAIHQDMADAAVPQDTGLLRAEMAGESATQDESPSESTSTRHMTESDSMATEHATKSQPEETPYDPWNDERIQEFAASFLSEDDDPNEWISDFLQPPAVKQMRRHKPEDGFSMMEALNDHPDLSLKLVTYLDIPTLISLYAIDKRFHFLLNSNYVAYIRASLRTWAPGSEDIFPWRAYRGLCIKDPVGRVKSKWEGKENLTGREFEERRDVPSLRWLQMVVYREGVCKDILIQLALKALYCPHGTSSALKRMWFMLDLPLNAHRIALIRSESYMSNSILLRLTCFFLKLDMHFTRPAGQVYPANYPNQKYLSNDWADGTFIGVEMREYLLAERNLTSLWRVLHGWSPDPTDPQCPMTRLDVLRMWVRHKYSIPPQAIGPVRKMSVMGVPWDQIGTQRLERTTNDNRRPRQELLRPDQLVMMEGIRRRLSLHRRWVELMVWGMSDVRGRPLRRFTEEEMNQRLMAMKI